jgi:DNA-binding protein HU-beta
MKKADLVSVVAEQAGLTKKVAAEAVNAVMEGISSALEKGDGLSLVGFGSFKVVDRAARDGRNPQTGKAIKIPARKAVKFSAGKTLKEAVQAKKGKGKKEK